VGGALQVWLVPEASGPGFTDAHCFVVIDRAAGEAMVIDAGSKSAPIALRKAAEANAKVTLLVSTHFHIDHTGGNAFILEKTAAKMVAPAKEASLITGEGLGAAEKKQLLTGSTPRIDRKVKGGDELKLGAHSAAVIEIPGHSPGSICLYFAAQKLLFSGDCIFKGSIGRLGLPQASKTHENFVAALRSKLLTLPDDTLILPGHGQATTIGAERASNPWFQETGREPKGASAQKGKPAGPKPAEKGKATPAPAKDGGKK